MSASLNALAKRAYVTALNHGFHERVVTWPDDGGARDARHILSWLMLITSEVSEAAEEVRKGTPEKFVDELADVIIRTIDVAEALGLDIEQAVLAKMAKNDARPFKHGGKRA